MSQRVRNLEAGVLHGTSPRPVVIDRSWPPHPAMPHCSRAQFLALKVFNILFLFDHLTTYDGGFNQEELKNINPFRLDISKSIQHVQMNMFLAACFFLSSCPLVKGYQLVSKTLRHSLKHPTEQESPKESTPPVQIPGAPRN